MDPDRKQQTNLNDEDDNFITEYNKKLSTSHGQKL